MLSGLLLLALAAGPTLRLSVDRAYLPLGSAEGQGSPADADSAPTVHLAARGTREVELTLYAVQSPLRAWLGLERVGPGTADLDEEPPLEVAVDREGSALRQDRERLSRALRPEARAAVKALLGLRTPVGTQGGGGAGFVSRVRRGESLLRSWRLPTGEAGWSYIDVDLGRLPLGLYRVEARAMDSRAELLVVVSGLALLANRTAEGTSILATQVGTGAPVAGVELYVSPAPRGAGSAGAAPVLLGRTGPTGLWTGRAALEGLVVGRAAGQLARLSLPRALPRDEPATRLGALFLDRSSARPGRSVHLWALLRDRRGPGAAGWQIPEAQTALLELLDREGRALLWRSVEISALGIVDGDLALPDGLRSGWYTVAVEWGAVDGAAPGAARAGGARPRGEQRRGAELFVEPAAPLELSASWELAAWSPLESPLVTRLIVLDRIGQPLAGAAVHWSAERRSSRPTDADEDSSDEDPWGGGVGPSELLAEGTGITDARGALAVRLDPGRTPGLVSLRAEVTDPAGREIVAEARTLRSAAPVALRLTPDPRFVRPGRPASVLLSATALDGSPWHGRLLLRAFAVHPGGGEAVRAEILSRSIELDGRGRASATLPPVSAGYVELEASIDPASSPHAPGPAPRGPALAQATVFVTEGGGDIPTTPDRLILIPDRRAYGRGEEARLLLLTPFESGLVLVSAGPGSAGVAAPSDLAAAGRPGHASPFETLVAVRGYSGVARFRVPPSGSVAKVSASALVGGTLYHEAVALALADRVPALSIRLAPERALRAGQRSAVGIEILDGAGHGLPAAVEALLSRTAATPAPPLVSLLSLESPATVEIFASSGAGDSLATLAPRPEVARAIQPYGPFEPAGSKSAPWLSSMPPHSSATADDAGKAELSLRPPGGFDRLLLTARAVAGPDLFAERRWELPLAPGGWLDLDAPPWLRAGDRAEVAARVHGPSEGIPAAEGSKSQAGLGCSIALGAGRVDVTAGSCEAGARRGFLEFGPAASEAEGAAGRSARSIEVTAALPAGHLSARRSVQLLLPREAGGDRSPLELAHELALELAAAAPQSGLPDLACAAVRALGAVVGSGGGGRRADERTPGLVAGAVASLVELERPEGGFGAAASSGADEVAAARDERRRDLAALEGLMALRAAGYEFDPLLIDRTRGRLERLSAGLEAGAAETLRRRIEAASRRASTLRSPPTGRPGHAPRPGPAPFDWRQATASELAFRTEAGRLPKAEAALAIDRIGTLLPGADPLDAAEVAAALARLDSGPGPTLGAYAAASRRLDLVVRRPWTAARLSADEEPVEPQLLPVEGVIPLGAELRVSLSVELPGAPRIACVRDAPAAGFAPVGLPEDRGSGVWLCGKSAEGRLALSYELRAVRVGRFSSPMPVVGWGARTAAAEILEVAR